MHRLSLSVLLVKLVFRRINTCHWSYLYLDQSLPIIRPWKGGGGHRLHHLDGRISSKMIFIVPNDKWVILRLSINRRSVYINIYRGAKSTWTAVDIVVHWSRWYTLSALQSEMKGSDRLFRNLLWRFSDSTEWCQAQVHFHYRHNTSIPET